MDQTERDPLDLDRGRIGQPCKLAAIRIAPDRRNRNPGRDRRKPRQNLRRADISRMKDPVAPGEQLKDPRPEQAVGVGKQADAHRGRL